MEVNQYYKPERYKKAEITEIRKFAKIRIRYLEKYLKKINPKKILELGCGEGSLGYEIKGSLPYAELYGFDLSKEGVKLANDKGIKARKADLNEGIPFKDNQFDLVFSNEFIEHINSTDLLFRESFRVLRRGGYFIVITPNMSFWLNRLIFLFGIYPIFAEVSTVNKTMGTGFLKKFIYEKEAVGHVRVFNLPALVDMLEHYGFKIEKKIGIPFSFKVPKFLGLTYNLLDHLFSRKASFARDIMVIAKK